MDRPPLKLTTRHSLVVDVVLIVVFFVVMYGFVSTHVPTNDPKMRLLWGGLCSSCLTAVFWLCVQMFRVVLSAQRQDRQK